MTESALAAALVGRFRGQRPLRGGSLIVTVFGDALAPRGGAISLSSLIALMRPLGLGERLVRTSVARLAAEDWLESRRRGRLSEYRLAEPGRERFAEATRRIYAGPAADWNGHWTLLLTSGVDAAGRARMRRLLELQGFGEPEPGLFAHPMIGARRTREYLAMHGLEEAPILLEARAAAQDARRLLAAGWDLRDLAARYRRFVGRYRAVALQLERGSAGNPGDAFAIRTLLIHEYRRVHLRDPLLPRQLLPTDWPGFTAYELCRRIYARVAPHAERHLTAVATTLDGPLPPADRTVRGRFPRLRRRHSVA